MYLSSRPRALTRSLAPSYVSPPPPPLSSCHTTSVTSLLRAAAPRDGATFSVVPSTHRPPLRLSSLLRVSIVLLLPSFFHLSFARSLGSLRVAPLPHIATHNDVHPRTSLHAAAPRPCPYVLTRAFVSSLSSLFPLAPTPTSPYAWRFPPRQSPHTYQRAGSERTSGSPTNPVESSRRFFALSHRLLH